MKAIFKPAITLLCAFSCSFLVAEVVTLSDNGLSVTLPDDWKRATQAPAGILVRAEADGGHLRFMLTKPPIAASGRVADADFQEGVKRSLRDQGFAKIGRAEMTKLSGVDAFLCEASMTDKPVSIMQVALIHKGSLLSLVFLSTEKPIKQVEAIQKIIESFKITP